MAEKEKPWEEIVAVRIINEGKQLSIRIPKNMVEALDIDPRKDVFLFKFDKDKLHLEGELATDAQVIEDE